MTSLPAAVLWDMDGTLVDTEPYWWAAEAELVRSFGGSWSYEDGMQLVGNGLELSAQILQQAGVRLDTESIVQQLTAEVLERLRESVPWRPGARELLAAYQAAGVPQAMVTMSRRSMAEYVDSCIDFAPFRLLVSADDVTRHKPHPEPYLEAARLLEVDIRECIAFEDSIPGTASAMASGALTFGIPHHIPLAAESAHRILPTLEGVTVEELSGLTVQLRGRG